MAHELKKYFRKQNKRKLSELLTNFNLGGLIMLLLRKNQDHLPTFSNLVDEFFNSDFEKYFAPRTSRPAVNISESEDAFALEVVAPGFKKEDFEISVKERVLTISSKKENEKEEAKEDNGLKYKSREFHRNSFSRSFELPEHVKADAITAKYESGILTIALPKEEPKPELSKVIHIE